MTLVVPVCPDTGQSCNRTAPCHHLCVLSQQRGAPLTPTGWRCPVCNKGNAPAAMTCGHCAIATLLAHPTIKVGQDGHGT